MKAYNRILIKISGEALAGKSGFGLCAERISMITDQIERLWKDGVQIGIVLGGGNFWRGRQGTSMERSTADHMGMLATVINALALQDALELERNIFKECYTSSDRTEATAAFLEKREHKPYNDRRDFI